MIEMNSQLIETMKKFKETFGDIVPLREIQQGTDNEMLIAVIEESITQNKNFHF